MSLSRLFRNTLKPPIEGDSPLLNALFNYSKFKYEEDYLNCNQMYLVYQLPVICIVYLT